MAETPILRLPTGMRDHAPEAASARRRIVDGLLATFERHGFARVITPAFEYEDVLALGLGDAARAATVRFVEPSSGEVVALRPDITPQIARLIATRYRDEPGPVRLCYEGTVVRLERGARGQRELMQAGVEVAGVPGPEGDADAIALAVQALAAVGLIRPTIDLGHLGLAREVLTALALPDAALAEARAKAPNAGIKRALAELGAIVAAVRGRKLDARLHVDLGEVRGFDYYTGVRFQAFVTGAASAVLQGGRYDGLLARYGRPSPAVGFAVDVDAVAGALDSKS